MGKIHRFLSVLLMTMCLSAVAFVPFNAVASTQETCYWNCSEWDIEKAKQVAKDVINGNDEEYKEAAGSSYCSNCHDNATLVNNFMARGSCMHLCEGDDCDARCEAASKRADEEQPLLDNCRDIGVSVGYEIGSLLSGGIAGATTEGKWSGFLTGWDNIGTLLGDWKSKDMENSGATFTRILNKYMGSNEGCWFCPAYDIIFDIINKTASELYVDLRDLCLFLLATFAMAWLLWTVFRFITTLHGPNVGEMVTKLFKGLFLIAILAIILRFPPSFITQYVVDPIAGLSTKLSQEIMATRGYENGMVTYTSYKQTSFQCGNTTLHGATPETSQRQICQLKPDNAYEGMALSAFVYNNINCMLRMMSTELVFGLAVGSTLISKSFEDRIIPLFKVLFVGLIVFVAYLMLFISVPLKLIDLLLRLAFVIILLPFFIACMATPATRGYTKKAWEMLLSCWITLISLFLYLTLVLTLLSEMLLNTD